MMTQNSLRFVCALAMVYAGCSGDSGGGQPSLVATMAVSGGATVTGGGLATGGSTPGATGGTAGTGGMTGTGGVTTGTGGAGSTGNGVCVITPTAVVSSVIATVATVTFTTDLAGMDKAEIEFGPETSYGMTAPVDLAEPDYKTYLVGMKQASTYHYRVVAMAGSTRCEGADNTVQTGSLANGIPTFNVTTPQPDKLNGGYIVGGFFVASFGGGGGTTGGKPAFIIDADGDYVWAYDAGDAGRVSMSPDAKYMWIRNTNVGGGASLVTRVSMDGTDVQTFGNGQSGFGDGHHDFAVMPNGNLLLIDHTGCDTIVERSTDGTARTIMDAGDAQSSAQKSCHVNSIHYLPDDDTITFSDLNPNHYVKIRRDTGEILWILGGTDNQFTGDGISWSKQHGHHWPTSDHMLMFNNSHDGEMGATSWIYNLQIDETAKTANRVLSYNSGSNSAVLGDVQQLTNGNTLVTVSTAGLMQEIDSAGAMVREYSTGAGAAFGFTTARDSLYGPPPRW